MRFVDPTQSFGDQCENEQSVWDGRPLDHKSGNLPLDYTSLPGQYKYSYTSLVIYCDCDAIYSAATTGNNNCKMVN